MRLATSLALLKLRDFYITVEGFFLSSVKYQVVKIEYRVKIVKYRVELVEYQVKIVVYRVKLVEYRVKIVEYRVELVEYQVKIVEYRVKMVEYRVKTVECPLHFLCTQCLQPLQKMLLFPISVRETAHGNSPELCRRSSPVPQIIIFVFPAFTLSPFFSIASFHVKSLLTHSSSGSAMITRSSA